MHNRYSWCPFVLFFLITYKGNGFPAIFFTSSTLYHTICRMNLFLSGAGGPKLASKHDGTRKKQRAQPLHHSKGFSCFCQKGIRVVRDLLCAAFASFARKNHPRGNRMVKNPTICGVIPFSSRPLSVGWG
ncbi:hypothetical protein, partial [Prevotella lacticifex]|uniref:hypothetical protein n=1 Tax=Prevotella lacticifex TaxID=2854755 RepID=UPI001CC7EB00